MAPSVAALRPPSRAPSTLTGSYQAALLSARAHFTMWLAGRAELVPRLPLGADSVAHGAHVDRVLAMPIAARPDGTLVVLTAQSGAFGVEARAAEAETAAEYLARSLACGPGPTLVHSASNPSGGTDITFALAAPPLPSTPLLPPPPAGSLSLSSHPSLPPCTPSSASSEWPIAHTSPSPPLPRKSW